MMITLSAVSSDTDNGRRESREKRLRGWGETKKGSWILSTRYHKDLTIQNCFLFTEYLNFLKH